MKSFLFTAAASAALALAASSASATDVTFAQFNGGSAGNFAYAKTVAGGVTTATTKTGKTVNGTFVPGAVAVKFSFTNMGPVVAAAGTNLDANFTFTATTTDTASSAFGNTQLGEDLMSGSFSFKSKTQLVFGHTTYAAGSNLLSGVFTDAFLSGGRNASAAAITANDASGTLTLSSDFLTFNNASTEGAGITLSALSPALQIQNGFFKPFKATAATGSFDSDPAPRFNAVPEPASWGMMLVGFGGLGALARRRRAVAA